MNELELYDIYDIWYEQPWIVRYKYLLGIVGILALALFALWYWNRYRARCRNKPWNKALRQLSQLDTLHDPKLFYSALTFTLKNYLSERYHIDLMSKTDQEIVLFCHNLILPEEVIQDLHKIFTETYVIKFSHEKVDASIVQKSLACGMRLVRNSIPEKTTT